MTMFLVLGVAASVMCLVGFVYLLADDASDTREEYEGF